MTLNSIVTFLINASWQVALIALAAAVCARFLRGGRARDEHRLWVAALQTAGGADIGPFTLPQPRIDAPAANVAAWIASLYVLFVGARLFVLWRGWRRTIVLRENAQKAEPLQELARRCRNAFGLRRAPVLFSGETDTPVTIARAVILPPDIAEKLSDEALLSVVGHEMAHIRRCDFAINLFYESLYALIAFHPAAALIRRRLAQTREQACDELVAETLVKPVRYAHALLDVAALVAHDAKPAWSLAMAGRGFEERVLRLARPRRRAAYARVMAVAACAVLAVTAAASVAFAVRADDLAELPDLCTPDAASIPRLVALLGDETPVEPTECLRRTTWSPAISTFVSPTVGEQAALALASIGEPSFAALLPVLDSRSPAARRNAAWAIGEIRGGHLVDREAAIVPLLNTIRDVDPTVRRAAAFAFGELRSSDAIEPLIGALHDSDDGVRAMSAWALGELRAAAARSVLERVAESDPNRKARGAAMRALGEIEGR
jgi:beta-lactamase regulating signal transducer with metallopeptidase domain